MNTRESSDALPRRGGRAGRWCWQLFLRLLGWEFEGEVPNLPRFVVIGAPHTSNWDFVIAMAIIGALDLRVTWLGKHTLFRWPFRAVMLRLGGIPVDRREPHGFVARAVLAFESEERLIIGITPEGTRKRTTRWKTGFYHIAVAASVPVVPGYIDFSRRRVGMGPPMMPTGDIEADLKKLRGFYAPFADAGRRPGLFGLGEDA